MGETRLRAAVEQATDTRAVLVAEGALRAAPAMVGDCFGEGAGAVVVADENTLAAAGEEVHTCLQGAGLAAAAPHVLPGRPAVYADYGNVERIKEALAAVEAVPVAVGAGTLNDLVKRAAHELSRPYMVVATAASVDGYTAFGASITRDGFKHTLDCAAPRAVLADPAVLASAPSAMTAAGYGDLLAKVSAGADWIVADELQVEAIEPRVWSLVQDPLLEATARPGALAAGDREALAALFEGLALSGLAIQAAGSSRPASGAEHQFSHLWEMEGLGLESDPPLSHGFKVAIGTLAISALYERALAGELDGARAAAVLEAWPSADELERCVREAFAGAPMVEQVVQEARAKHPDRRQLAARLGLLRERGPRLRERLAEQLLAAGRVREQLRQAGCPIEPEQIGLERRRLRDSYTRARVIRRRYTVLDLLYESGRLERCVAELFQPGGAWGPPPPP